MHLRRLFVTLLGSLVLMGVSVSMAQKAVVEPAPRPLEPGAVAVRLLLGVGDEAPVDWSGRASVDRGEIVAVEGVRFREGDEVTGRDSWKAQSCLVRRLPTAKAAAKAAAKAKRKALAQAKRKAIAQAKRKAIAQAAKETTGPSTVGPEVFPNGVVLSMKDVAGATLAVETSQGPFRVALDRLAHGSIASALDGRVRLQRVFPHAPLIEGPGQQDFPAAVADSKDGAWVVYVHHESRGPEQLPALTERPGASPIRCRPEAATRFDCSTSSQERPAHRSM